MLATKYLVRPCWEKTFHWTMQKQMPKQRAHSFMEKYIASTNGQRESQPKPVALVHKTRFSFQHMSLA